MPGRGAACCAHATTWIRQRRAQHAAPLQSRVPIKSELPTKTPNVYVTIGANLKRLRKDKGFTLEDLSERADLSVSFLSHIERGTRQAPLTTLENLGRLLGSNLYGLFNAPTPAPSAREKASPYDGKIARLIKGLSEKDKKSVHSLLKRLHKS